jgi:hypothetical protein
LLFLLGALVSLAVAYPFYASATGAPDVNLEGFVLVLTDDPAISLRVELHYSHEVRKSRGPSGVTLKEWVIPHLGDDQIKSLLLKVYRTGKKDSKPHRYLAIFSGDARLRDVALYKPIETRSMDQAHIEFRTVSSESDIQTFEGTMPDTDRQVELSGDLTRPVTDTAAGKTFVRIPSLGSVLDASHGSWGSANEAIAPREVLVSGERWFSPKSVNYAALVGSLPVGKSIDEERPLVDAKHPDQGPPIEIQWSGSEMLFPQARLSDNTGEQQAAKRIFLAGILGGIGGSFLVEGLSRLRLVRRQRPKEQTETAQK